MTARESIENKIKGKSAYTLNMTDGMNDRIIDNAQKIIDHLDASKERMREEYEAEKTFFEEAKARWDAIKQQWDNLDEEINQQNILISTMRNFRKSDKKDKRLNVVKDPEEKEGTPAPKRVSWIHEAVKVLEKEQRFMSAEAIAEKILADPEVQETAKNLRVKKVSHLKGQAVILIESHATQTAQGRHKTSRMFKPYLTTYNNLVGLYEWVDQDNVPKPEFMKEFMYSNQ